MLLYVNRFELTTQMKGQNSPCAVIKHPGIIYGPLTSVLCRKSEWLQKGTLTPWEPGCSTGFSPSLCPASPLNLDRWPQEPAASPPCCPAAGRSSDWWISASTGSGRIEKHRKKQDFCKVHAYISCLYSVPDELIISIDNVKIRAG